jgi:hypothetical protein
MESIDVGELGIEIEPQSPSEAGDPHALLVAGGVEEWCKA